MPATERGSEYDFSYAMKGDGVAKSPSPLVDFSGSIPSQPVGNYPNHDCPLLVGEFN